jgi:hypothetical protein
MLASDESRQRFADETVVCFERRPLGRRGSFLALAPAY